MSPPKRPPHYAAGDVRGAYVILHGGRPEVPAAKRVVRVRCTLCGAVGIVTERHLRRREASACYECVDRGRPSSGEIVCVRVRVERRPAK